mmetsp:Transcript_10223/g.30848  ORF Transcript_10223/g.30848 Transcript_10223/m.30848 type:complete len:207 (-) Transcript_10223:282-902(-)
MATDVLTLSRLESTKAAAIMNTTCHRCGIPLSSFLLFSDPSELSASVALGIGGPLSAGGLCASLGLVAPLPPAADGACCSGNDETSGREPAPPPLSGDDPDIDAGPARVGGAATRARPDGSSGRPLVPWPHVETPRCGAWRPTNSGSGAVRDPAHRPATRRMIRAPGDATRGVDPIDAGIRTMKCGGVRVRLSGCADASDAPAQAL